jgi:hypothetical protein
MRIGDFAVTLVPAGGGQMIEMADATVLARAGQVYSIEIGNHSRQRALARVSIDGLNMTNGGLVLGAYETLILERPVTHGERGRFTVFGEGDERVFGADGGRSNPALGLIEVTFRKEARSTDDELSLSSALFDRVTASPPEPRSSTREENAEEYERAEMMPDFERVIERAAGTGLTGRSRQEFRIVEMGTLEEEKTVIRLRLVIGAAGAFGEPRPLPGVRGNPAPPRPTPRP